MAARMRAMDWSATGLGPVAQWPRSLKTMLGVVLGSRFPMLLWWGPELLHLYNDAYRPILRNKHPASLAAPAAEVWAEVWDVAGPMVRSVQEGGAATWTEDLQLFIASGDMAEETYFTFSYSPVPGDNGQIAGILNTVQETTSKVQGERQIRMLHELAARGSQAKSEHEACEAMVQVLARNELDLPFVLLFLLEERSGKVRCAARSGLAPDSGGADASAWPFAEVMRTGREVVVTDLAQRFSPLSSGRWNVSPTSAVVLPLARAGLDMPAGFLVAGVSPHRRMDDRYDDFFHAAADQVASALAGARAYGAETRRAQALAELDEAKTAFFSNVSHEFRTPLTLILGIVNDTLAHGDALAGEDLLVVQRSGVRLLRLVNSLLDFTRIEAGRLRLSFEPTDLSDLTIALVGAFHSLVERAGMELSIDCPPLPEQIHVDRSQWEKIVLNLVSNAFKFTFEGRIEVSLRWRGSHVELRVQDTGTGIPAAEVPHIFERFHRVPHARGRSFEGTGIGLALVQELVKLHGGSVGVSSVEGRGSTFTVMLPTGTAHLPAEQVSRSSTAGSPNDASAFVVEASQWMDSEACGASQANVLRLPAAKMPTGEVPMGRILVVDDNTDMRIYLCRLLQPHWEVHAAADGAAALSAAKSSPPDLILSDIMMPGLDGFALLRELRADPRTRTVPIILLSARAGEESILEGLEQGADDYLAKPFTTQELLARVRTHLTMARARNALVAELARVNADLEAFSYSVAHDLRAPLRTIDGFSIVLLSEYGSRFDADAMHCLTRIVGAVRGMNQMIDDLLMLSRMDRAELRISDVDLSAMASEVLDSLRFHEPKRGVHARVSSGVVVRGDASLLRIVLQNLIGNAWKYTSRCEHARIEFSTAIEHGQTVYVVRDNGAGFDMRFANKLFKPFQRLHRASEFPGTGIGLATVQRIVHRHGGHIRAESVAGQGASFFFTLG